METCELHFSGFPVPVANLIGGVEGQGFKQVMTGLEAERLNVAARGLGIARAAFEEAIRYAQRRITFGKPIAEYQTIQNKLADMATHIEASRLLIYSACEKRDRGERCDLEAGMAKLFATETAAEVSLEAMRIMGANGYSKDFPVERYYRDAPLVVIGGGTNELQRLIIARNLLKKYKDGRVARGIWPLLRGVRSWRGVQTLAGPHPHRIRQHALRVAVHEPESALHRRALCKHSAAGTQAHTRFVDL